MNPSFFGSEEPGGKPVVGKGRGKVLEELTGLYRTTGRAACLQKLVSPRQQDKHGYAGKAAITHVLVMLHHHALDHYYACIAALTQVLAMLRHHAYISLLCR